MTTLFVLSHESDTVAFLFTAVFPHLLISVLLKVFYGGARDAALSVTSKILGFDLAAPEIKVCNAGMRLMLQILTWEFQYNRNGTKSRNVFSTGVRHDNALSNRTECILVQVFPQDLHTSIHSGLYDMPNVNDLEYGNDMGT